MKNLILQTFHLCLFLGAALIYGQSTVGGLVTDGETGTPLPGVNVLIQGTTTGVSTDFDGDYSIQAEEGQVLEFSYLGFEVQTITVSGDQLDVSLQPSTNFLDEIVVTGYGTQSRREVTASIATVNAENIERIATGSGVDAIKGQVAGVDITSSGGRPWKRFRPTPHLLSLWDRTKDARYDKGYKHVWYSNNPIAGQSVGDTALYIPGPGVDKNGVDQDAKWTQAAKDGVIYQVYTTDQYNQRIFPSLNKWIDNTRPNRQHTQGQRDFILMRLADAYLIRAEANHKQGNNQAAADDLNIIRRRGAWAGQEAAMEITAADVDIDFILDERARELVGEGHRWFDLVRTGKLIERVKAHNIDGSPNIQSHHVLRPIPLDQIDRTEGGYGQNAGYTQ